MKNIIGKLFNSLRPTKEYCAWDVDADLQARRERMEVKRQQAIEELGTKWILHPNNKKSKLEKVRPV